MASESVKRKYKNRHKCFKKMPKIRQLILDDDIWAITCKHSVKSEWQNEHHNKGFSYYTKIQRKIFNDEMMECLEDL